MLAQRAGRQRQFELFAMSSVEDDVLRFVGHVHPRDVEAEFVVSRQAVQHATALRVFVAGHRVFDDGSVTQRSARIGNEQWRVDSFGGAQASAGPARSCWIVEREVAVVHRAGDDVMVFTAHCLVKPDQPGLRQVPAGFGQHVETEVSVAQLESVFQRGEDLFVGSLLYDELIDDDFDLVVVVFVDIQLVTEIDLFAVEADVAVAVDADLFEQVFVVFAKDPPHGGSDFDFRAFGKVEHVFHHLARAEHRDVEATERTMRFADRREKHAQVV